MEEFKVLLDVVNKDNSDNLKNILLVLGPVAVVLIQVVTQFLLAKSKEKFDSKKEKSDKVRHELENFYYPVLELLRKNKILYEVFTNNKGNNFRTLTELIKGSHFSLNDKALLDEIIEIDNEINTLFFKYKHIIKDERQLSDVINNASVHFTLMKMAYEGKIKMEESRFSNYVFPRDLEENIEKKVTELTKYLL